ncbi:Thioredoxin- transmembrane protein 1 [Cichlidogyrus casuarinus]|uniref:Thioredoxin- transmembrane protein 1 n=1 Tax=Cichlidogyrus casuarinus TaxID=1844966 RepID=A0ABD2Q744_9PLAT
MNYSHAPWCPACKATKPIWTEFSKHVSDQKQLRVASVDITRNPQLGLLLSIQHIPTIYFIREGKYYEYKGDRSADSFESFYREQHFRNMEPITGFMSPDSLAFRLSMPFVNTVFLVTNYHQMLVDSGWSSVSATVIFVVALLVCSITIGIIVIIIFDCFCPPRPQILRYLGKRNVKPPQPVITKENDTEPDSIIAHEDTAVHKRRPTKVD